MIRLRVDEAAAIPLAVESASPVSMTVKEEFIDRGGSTIQNNKNATPGTAAVVVTPDQGFDGMAKVTVAAIPQGALSPIDIDFDDSTGAFTAEARVGTSGYISDDAFVGGGFQLATQEAATITPSTVQQQAVAAHKYTKGAVVVDPIPSEYVIPLGTKNITANGNNQDVKAYEKVNVNVPNTYAAGDEGKVVSNGALVAQTSDTVTQNGTVDTTLINSLLVNVQASGGRKVSGSFTIASDVNNNNPTITHNFGTKKIAAVIYPVSIAASGGYQMFYVAYIGVPYLIDDGAWTLDFTSYNSAKFPDVVTADVAAGGTDQSVLKDVSRQSSPWTTQNTWYAANNEATWDSAVVLTDDTIKPSFNRFAVGTYKYIVFDLS